MSCSPERGDKLSLSEKQLVGKADQSNVWHSAATKLENVCDALGFPARSAPH
jgi:hypothetical protein